MRSLISAALLSLPLAAPAFTVSTADGDGKELEDITLADGKVAGGPLDGLKAEDLVQLSFAAATAPAGKVEVRLVTGDVLWGSFGKATESALSLDTVALGGLTLKLEQVQSIVYAERLQGAALAALQDRLALDRSGMDHDFCYLVGGDRVRFYVRSADERSVRGEDDDHRAYEFPIAQVAALSMMSTMKPPVPEGLQVRLTTMDGGMLGGGITAIRDGKVALAHPLLGALSIPVVRLAATEVLGGRVVSLPDLDPVGLRELPYIGEASLFHWRRDRQVVDGRPIQLRGRPYARGLGVHAYCELSYELGGAFARFRSDVGIDDSTKGGGSAEAVVKLDGKERFRARISGKDPAQKVDLDCRGAKRLTLVVDFGEDREILDRAVWAGPILVKEAR